jgi:site-specific recombinase XerD
MLLNEAITLIFARQSISLLADTQRGYERDCRLFCVWAHNPNVMNVTIDQIEQFLQDMIDAGFSQNSTVHRICALKQLFRGLRRRGFIVLNPEEIPKPRKLFIMPKVATDEDIQKALDYLPYGSTNMMTSRDRAILLMLRDTGMRVGELASLKVNDIDFGGQKATIKTEKTRGRRPFRQVFWFKDCNDSLQHWLIHRERLLKSRHLEDHGALFICINSQGIGQPLHKTSIGIMLRKVAREVGAKYLNPHSLRHRKGHLLALQGASNSVISGVLGHSQLSSSFIYTNLSDPDIEKVARKFGRE